MPFRFPKTMAAANANERDQWALGDALLEECGRPGDDSAHTGSLAKIEQAQKELADHGREYNVDTLRTYRDISDAYPPASRDAGVSHRVHVACRTPEMLRSVMHGWEAWLRANPDQKKRPVPLHDCGRILREIRARQDADQEARQAAGNAVYASRRQAAQAAVNTTRANLDAARVNVATATTASQRRQAVAARERAEREHREAQRVRSNLPHRPERQPLETPAPERMSQFVFLMQLGSRALQASALADEALEMVGDLNNYNIDNDSATDLVERAMTAANKWREIARAIARVTGVQGQHLAVVGEE